MDEKRKQEFFEELEKLSSEECYVGQAYYDESEDDWCGTGYVPFSNTFIVRFYAIKRWIMNLFRRKKEEEKIEILPSPIENETAKKLYSDTAPELRDKVFYGDVQSAQTILVLLANECFRSTSEQAIKLCYHIYIQCWLRCRGFSTQFSEPGHITLTLTQEFPKISRRKVKACAKRSLEYIFLSEYFSELESATDASTND